MIVLLENITTANGKMEDRNKCRTTSSATPTLSGYQTFSDKTFQSSYDIEDPTKFATYKTDKNFVLIELDQGLFNRSLLCAKFSKSGQQNCQPWQPSQLISNIRL